MQWLEDFLGKCGHFINGHPALALGVLMVLVFLFTMPRARAAEVRPGFPAVGIVPGSVSVRPVVVAPSRVVPVVAVEPSAPIPVKAVPVVPVPVSVPAVGSVRGSVAPPSRWPMFAGLGAVRLRPCSGKRNVWSDTCVHD